MAKIKIYVYEKNAFFVDQEDNDSNTVTFFSNNISNYTVSINGDAYRSTGAVCRIPADRFKIGESYCEITTNSGVHLVSEGMTNRGGLIYPSGLRNKRMVIDLIRKVSQLEKANTSMSEKLKELEVFEAEFDLLSI